MAWTSKSLADLSMGKVVMLAVEAPVSLPSNVLSWIDAPFQLFLGVLERAFRDAGLGYLPVDLGDEHILVL